LYTYYYYNHYMIIWYIIIYMITLYNGRYMINDYKYDYIMIIYDHHSDYIYDYMIIIWPYSQEFSPDNIPTISGGQNGLWDAHVLGDQLLRGRLVARPKRHDFFLITQSRDGVDGLMGWWWILVIFFRV
jgi:hypothetical protein